ncbi:hypothetical protein WG901_22145 [Novosphingobium sp. PS1R-30]|uniref:Uncharacterized protein n=1 Tax=Novosphingobium anseongense TaxID=3133436 RepID=A0ABU8S3B4_9SPHN
MLEHPARWLGAPLNSVCASHAKLPVVEDNIRPRDGSCIGENQ